MIYIIRWNNVYIVYLPHIWWASEAIIYGIPFIETLANPIILIGQQTRCCLTSNVITKDIVILFE